MSIVCFFMIITCWQIAYFSTIKNPAFSRVFLIVILFIFKSLFPIIRAFIITSALPILIAFRIELVSVIVQIVLGIFVIIGHPVHPLSHDVLMN